VETKFIECKKINRRPPDRSKRTFSKEFAQKLSVSIKEDGLLSAIFVTFDAETGRYTVVNGDHRFYAVHKILKMDLIEAKIADPDFSRDDAEHAADVENLWRIPTSASQRQAALARWFAAYSLKHPEKVRNGKVVAVAESAVVATIPNPPGGLSDGHGTASVANSSTREADGKKTSTETAGFVEIAAAATGQSRSSTAEAVQLARIFDEAQFEVFDIMSTSEADKHTIARVKDREKRDQIVSLVASGKDPMEAIREVIGDEAPERRDKHRSKAQKAGAKAAKSEAVPELSDDDWFAQECAEKAAMFKDATKYRADALLFRKISDARHAFRVKAKNVVASTKEGLVGGSGPFVNLVNRFISIAHPKDWLLCDQCKGRGHMSFGERCGRCYGGGFLLKVEAYL
jgi:hypothetical protein